MKSIILFRHATSDWSINYRLDHDRPLASYGIKEAKKMGLYLSKINKIPDLVISSTAVRAKRTIEIAMQEGEWKSSLILNSDIYGGKPNFLLKLAQQQTDNFDSICFVGHEPNFSGFISLLTDNDAIHFPMASMAKIDFQLSSWSHISRGFGLIDWIVNPKAL